jgi:microcystin-dependent protein
MGTDLEKGTTYVDGQQVTATNLNAHVDNATIKYTAIQTKALKDPAGLSDELLINDAGVLKKITLQQITSLVTIPPGAVTDYAGTTAPTGWLLCYGQAISRVSYSALFTAIGTTYGAGDASTTFNLPDCRGRVSAGKDNMGGSSADRLTTPIDGDTLGAAGGAENHALTIAQMPSHTHVISNTIVQIAGPALAAGGGGNWQASATASTGGGGVHPNVQPTIVFNKIIKT